MNSEAAPTRPFIILTAILAVCFCCTAGLFTLTENPEVVRQFQAMIPTRPPATGTPPATVTGTATPEPATTLQTVPRQGQDPTLTAEPTPTMIPFSRGIAFPTRAPSATGTATSRPTITPLPSLTPTPFILSVPTWPVSANSPPIQGFRVGPATLTPKEQATAAQAASEAEEEEENKVSENKKGGDGSGPTQEPCSCAGDLLNCGDFGNDGNAAQACFDFCQSQGFGDVHGLDGDNDGLACEE